VRLTRVANTNMLGKLVWDINNNKYQKNQFSMLLKLMDLLHGGEIDSFCYGKQLLALHNIYVSNSLVVELESRSIVCG
jgi:hypothetical protein